MHVRQRSVNRGKVLLNNRVALLGISLLNRVLDFRNRLFARQNVGNREEARLHDGVDALAHAGFARNFYGVDGVELQLLVDNLLLNFISQVIPDFVCVIRRVQQEGCARFGDAQDVHLVHKLELVAGNEVSLVNQVGGLNRVVGEAQVRRRHRAGLAAVIDEVALAVLAGVFGDNLNRVLVGADGTVCTQTEEDGADNVLALGVDAVVISQRLVGYVIVYTDGETVNRVGGYGVVEHGLDHARRELFGRQTVTAAQNLRHADFACRGSLRQSGDNVQIQRFAGCAGLFGSVKYGNDFRRFRQSGNKRLGRERTIQMYFQNAELLTLRVQVVNRFLNGFGAGAHNDDNLFGISRAVVFNNVILAAGDFGELVHFFLNDAGNGVIIFVGSFAALEEDVRVLRRTADDRGFRTQRVFGVELVVYAFEHGAEVVVRQQFDFLDFVRGAETVKEVHERNARTQRRSLRNRGHVVRFLHRVGAEHRKTGLAAAHNVSVVAENRQRVVRERTGGNVHDERRKFAGDFVHIRNHQEQTLRSRKGGGQRTGLQGAVACAGGTGFGLHFLHVRNHAPEVLLFGRRPRIRPFAHRRRRGNRVDNADFVHAVGNRSGRFVPVHHFHFHI